MIYSFGPFRYDAGQRLLFRGEDLVALAPKTIDLLHVLLERHGQVVTKAELLQLVWPDTRVEEIGLARNISLLRKALGDESDEALYITTIPKRGYRFVAEVSAAGSETEAPAPQAAEPVGTPERQRIWIWTTVGALTVGFVYYQFFVPSWLVGANGRQVYIAVAPLACDCDSAGGDALAQSYGDSLVTELSKRGGVTLAGPSTVRRYAWAHISMSVMGRLLGLDALIEGTLERQSGGAGVRLRLVDVRTGRLIWAERFEGERADAGAVAAVIHARLMQGSGH